MAVTLALFPWLGTCPSCIVLLNMIEIGITSDGKIALINYGVNLFIFKIWNWSITSCSVITMSDSSGDSGEGDQGAQAHCQA
jgi:hypothetical protein